MVRDARKIARALGDTSALIYSAPRTREPEPALAGIDRRILWLHPELARRLSARRRADS